MKRLGFLIFILSLVSILSAKIELQDSYQVGMGAFYRSYIDNAGPWALYVLEMDVSNSYNEIKVVKAQDGYIGKETVRSMASRSEDDNHRILGAVNGDFFDINNGITNSSCVVDGEYVKAYYNYRSAFAYTDLGKPTIIDPRFSCSLICHDDTTKSDTLYPISAYNTSRYTGYLCLYNSYMGSSTATNSSGCEYLANPIEPWCTNDTISCVIEGRELNVGNMSIPNGKIILSGHGIADTFLRDYCDIGDTVKIVQTLLSTHVKIKQMMGGGPTILSNGENVVEEAYQREHFDPLTCTVRHPHTALGFSEDSTIVYFVTVDGRQDHSIGMTLYELSDFMKAIGIKNGINIDGGGSSTMLVRNTLMNSPSDGSERTVANGTLCLTSAPLGENLAHVQFKRDSLNVYKNHSISTLLTGWDEYYNPRSIHDWTSVNISFDTSLGFFNENIFSANELNGDTYLTADYNGDSDSVLIHIIELTDLSIYPESVTVDTVNNVEFQITATNEANATKGYDNGIFEFSVLDPTIATVDDDGFVIGKRTGETQVIVHYGDETDTATVKVEIGEGEVVVDELESINGWNISGDSFIEMNATSLSLTDRTAGTGSKAIKVDYSHTGNEDGMITLTCDPVNIYGVPSYILVDVLSDSNKNWLYVDLEDARGVAYSVKCSASLRYNDDYRTQYLNMGNLLPSDGEQLYPLKVTGVRLRIDDLATTGTMYVDRIRLTYPGWTDVEDDPSAMIPTGYMLYQNYPNPFNPNTTISYDIPDAGDITLDVFDITGGKVATLYSGYQPAGTYHVNFSAEHITTGVYFYRLTAGRWVSTRKMLIIK